MFVNESWLAGRNSDVRVCTWHGSCDSVDGELQPQLGNFGSLPAEGTAFHEVLQGAGESGRGFIGEWP